MQQQAQQQLAAGSDGRVHGTFTAVSLLQPPPPFPRAKYASITGTCAHPPSPLTSPICNLDASAVMCRVGMWDLVPARQSPPPPGWPALLCAAERAGCPGRRTATGIGRFTQQLGNGCGNGLLFALAGAPCPLHLPATLTVVTVMMGTAAH